MRTELDRTADALYIYVTEQPVAATEELHDGTVVDVDAAGQLVGVEILAASNGWSSDAVQTRFTLSDPDAETMRALAQAAISGPADRRFAALAAALLGQPALGRAAAASGRFATAR